MANRAKPVRIVTDSAADIPQEIADELGIVVVPLRVHMGDKTFLDGVDISGEAFYRELESIRSVTTTSLPSLQSFADAYRKVTSEGNEVVSVHMSSKLSGTFNAALIASTADDLPDESISVIDSRTVSMAQGWIAIRAAEAAREGKSLAEITDLAESLVPRVGIFGALDTLDYLIRSGRVGRLPGTVGTMLSVKPILTTRQNGEAAIIERVRTLKRALEQIVELLQQAGPLERLAVMHGDNEPCAHALLDLLKPLDPPQPVIICHIGAVLGTHVGPGAVGVCYLTR